MDISMKQIQTSLEKRITNVVLNILEMQDLKRKCDSDKEVICGLITLVEEHYDGNEEELDKLMSAVIDNVAEILKDKIGDDVGIDVRQMLKKK